MTAKQAVIVIGWCVAIVVLLSSLPTRLFSTRSQIGYGFRLHGYTNSPYTQFREPLKRTPIALPRPRSSSQLPSLP